MIAILIYGYISILVFIVSVLSLAVMLCVLYSGGYFNSENNHLYQEQLDKKNNGQTIILDSEYALIYPVKEESFE